MKLNLPSWYNHQLRLEATFAEDLQLSLLDLWYTQVPVSRDLLWVTFQATLITHSNGDRR